MKTILVTILFFISAFMAMLLVLSFRRRKKSPCAFSLGLVLLSLVVYSGGYACELSSSTLGEMLLWNTIEYLGVSFLPAFWIIFTARYVNARLVSSRRIMSLLLFISLMTFVAVCTDPVFHLRYTTVFVRPDAPFPVLGFTRGLFYWTHTAYVLFALLIGTFFLFRNLFMTFQGFFQRQQIFMIAGSCLPWINYLLYLFGVTVWGIDTIPFSLFISAVFFGIAIFGYGVLDAAPVARSIVFETMSDGAIVLDRTSRIVDFNRVASSIFPSLNDSALSGDLGRVLSDCKTLCSGVEKGCDTEFQFTTKLEGSLRYYQCKISNITSRNNTLIGKVILFKDNTDSTLLLEKLKELATIDPLTRLFNRRHFIELANRQIDYLSRGNRPLSIVILDLDFFKNVNDTYGHLVGDEVLRSVANVLTSGVRGSDFVARFGGEEFICFLSETCGSAAFEVVERLRESIHKNRIDCEGFKGISVTASFGMYCVERPSGAETIDAYIGHADSALYRAKEEGRNRTVAYEPGVC